MPRRLPPDLSGFQPQPFVRYPGGRSAASDVHDAGMELQFGGTPISSPRVSNPRTTVGEPRVQLITQNNPPDFARIGGRLVVETGGTIFPSDTYADGGDRTFRNLPHQAVDFSDEWWRNAPANTFAEAELSNAASGDIWADPNPTPMPHEAVAPFDDPSQDWVGETPTQTAASDNSIDPHGDMTPPGEPVAPFDDSGTLPGTDVSDPNFPTVEVPRRTGTPRTSAGPDIRNFGGNLTLGDFLGQNLSDLHYGEGRYRSGTDVAAGGRPNDLQPGEGYIDPYNQTGGHWVDVEGGGQQWIDDAPTESGRPAPGTPMTVNGHEVRPAEHVDDSRTQVSANVYRDASGRYFNNSGVELNPFEIDVSTGRPYVTGSYPGDMYAGYGYENKNNNVDEGQVTFGLRGQNFGSVMDGEGGFATLPGARYRANTVGGLNGQGRAVNNANRSTGIGLRAYAQQHNPVSQGGRG